MADYSPTRQRLRNFKAFSQWLCLKPVIAWKNVCVHCDSQAQTGIPMLAF